jgi:hypothetical protein
VGFGGLTTMLATACVTVSVVVPSTPAALAVIVVVPLATAVATPVLASIVAVAGVELAHVNVGCVASRTSSASNACAVKACVAPSAVRVGSAGLTTMLATACVTVSVVVPSTPAALAVIVVVPLATAVATPVLASIVAVAGVLDAHVNVGCVAKD